MAKYTLSELLKLEYAGLAPHSEGHLQQIVTLLFGGYEHTPFGEIVCGQKPDSVFRLETQERAGCNPNEESHLKKILNFN